jgi:aminopeptidase N
MPANLIEMALTMAWWLGHVSLQAPAPLSVRTFDVIHYEARLEPDIATKAIKGQVVLSIAVTADNQDAIELDSGDLVVDAVREHGMPREFVQNGRRLRIWWSRPARMNDSRQFEIDYHGAPRVGLRFFPDRSQVYTLFSTSEWLVCVDAPDDRATIGLTVVLPVGLKAVANGRLVAERRLTRDTVAFKWRQDRPVPSYAFGFAAGPFTEVTEQRGHLRYLGAGFSESELRRIFRDSADMISFFEKRAGVRYADPTYTQVLVSQTAGQEMSSFAVMSEDYGRAVLADESAVSLVAHELAHQWWGNMVTCQAWTHFWLNEGFATFMAAAYTEERFGRQAYLREIEAARLRYQKVRDAGFDKSLVFPAWTRPTADDRTLVYQKGAYVLHLLRETLGERAFWNGIRHYTRTHFGKSVTTADFQAAMEQSSGRNLSEFFAEWVFLTRTH